MQPPQPDVPSAVSLSNVLDNRGLQERELDSDEPQSGAFADLVVAAGVLALVVTGFVVVGPRLGGPVPTFRFWTILGPLLVLPLAILFGLLLAPGGVIPDRVAGWRPRVALGVGGLIAFVAALLMLNLPTLLATR